MTLYHAPKKRQKRNMLLFVTLPIKAELFPPRHEAGRVAHLLVFSASTTSTATAFLQQRLGTRVGGATLNAGDNKAGCRRGFCVRELRPSCMLRALTFAAAIITYFPGQRDVFAPSSPCPER